MKRDSDIFLTTTNKITDFSHQSYILNMNKAQLKLVYAKKKN